MAEKLPKREKALELAHEEMKEIAHEEPKEIEEEKKLELPEETGKELEEDLIRLQAEFENYRKRTAKEMQERSEMGKMDFAKSLLPFVDEFEHASDHFDGEHKKYSADASAEIFHILSEYEKGIEMMLANLKKILEKEGVREMKCAGEKYDPYKHEVILQQESDKPEGTIITVARKGYFFKDFVLRHAQVIVAKKKIEKKNETEIKKPG